MISRRQRVGRDGLCSLPDEDLAPADGFIVDTHGRDVDNPVFEFDACFDPHS